MGEVEEERAEGEGRLRYVEGGEGRQVSVLTLVMVWVMIIGNFMGGGGGEKREEEKREEERRRGRWVVVFRVHHTVHQALVLCVLYC